MTLKQDGFVKFYFAIQGPVIIVPTNYYTVPTDHFRELGISMIIWANHNMRASIAAMQETTQQIYLDQSLVNVEDKVGSNKMFKLFSFELCIFCILRQVGHRVPIPPSLILFPLLVFLLMV